MAIMQVAITSTARSERPKVGFSDRETVHQVEREKWNSLVPDDAEMWKKKLSDKDFAAYVQRSSTMPGILEFLGDLRGKRVLEYGCGLGQVSVLLAKSGAEVTAFDIAEESVNFARKFAELNGVGDRIHFDACPAEDLPYEDESFDVVFGKAVLHHLPIPAAQPHLVRVVKPGGKAAFSEPMGMNPILNFVRDRVYYPKKNPRGADRPVNYDEINAWAQGFSSCQIREVQLLSMLERGFGFGLKLRSLRKMDDLLLARFPSLRKYCRYVVMLMTK